jgi:hypothetical protein
MDAVTVAIGDDHFVIDHALQSVGDQPKNREGAWSFR